MGALLQPGRQRQHFLNVHYLTPAVLCQHLVLALTACPCCMTHVNHIVLIMPSAIWQYSIGKTRVMTVYRYRHLCTENLTHTCHAQTAVTCKLVQNSVLGPMQCLVPMLVSQVVCPLLANQHNPPIFDAILTQGLARVEESLGLARNKHIQARTTVADHFALKC